MLWYNNQADVVSKTTSKGFLHISEVLSMNKIAKIIRIFTVAPLMALLTVVVLYIASPESFGGNPWLLVLSIFFLTVLPLLAYPMQNVIPYFKDKGREGQRNLAMLFANGGYILGCITNLFMDAPAALWIIYLEYLFSGMLILIFNKVFKLRASAHACGVIGPGVMLFSFGVHAFLIVSVILWGAALWGSLAMKRHTLPQYLGGSVIPIAVLAVLQLIF